MKNKVKAIGAICLFILAGMGCQKLLPKTPADDSILDKNGKIKINQSVPLSDCTAGKFYIVINLIDTSDAFLQFLGKLNILPGLKIKLLEKLEYDNSFSVEVLKKTVQLSEKVARNILVQSV